MRVVEAERLRDGVAVVEADAPRESVRVLEGERVRVADAVAEREGMMQVATMASSLKMPKQGSLPNR